MCSMGRSWKARAGAALGRSGSFWGGWLASMVFAVHPVNVASVAWITELKNTLSTMLGLGAVLAYLTFEGTGEREQGTGRRWVWYGLAVVLFALGLLTKAALVGLPV